MLTGSGRAHGYARDAVLLFVQEELRSLKLLFCTLAARFEDFEPLDTRVQYFWEALNNFTNGE